MSMQQWQVSLPGIQDLRQEKSLAQAPAFSCLRIVQGWRVLVFHVDVTLFSEGKYKLWHWKELSRCLEGRCQCVGQQFLLKGQQR